MDEDSIFDGFEIIKDIPTGDQREDQLRKVRYMMARQDEAYKYSPTGTWFEIWIPGICKHERIRCIHGDEIIYCNGKRGRCMICDRTFWDFPKICFFTGEPH